MALGEAETGGLDLRADGPRHEGDNDVAPLPRAPETRTW